MEVLAVEVQGTDTNVNTFQLTIMPFEVLVDNECAHPVVMLNDSENGTSAEIYSFGAMLNKFIKTHNGQRCNVIDGFDSVEHAIADQIPAFKSAKLSPFVCRIKNAKYQFGETDHMLTKYVVNNSALHGLVFDKVFEIKETVAKDDMAKVVFEYIYDKTDEGYPFTYRCMVEYSLEKEHQLNIITTITNIDNQLIPIADGWHPYFNLGDPIDECQLEFQSKEVLEFTQALLPTGKLIPYQEYGSLQTLGNTLLDNCYTVNFAECQPMVVFRNPNKKIQVEIHPSTSYPYLQVFTPPHRNSLAIENLSSPPDAFNNFMGLHVLEPGETVSFATKYLIKSI